MESCKYNQICKESKQIVRVTFFNISLALNGIFTERSENSNDTKLQPSEEIFDIKLKSSFGPHVLKAKKGLQTSDLDL